MEEATDKSKDKKEDSTLLDQSKTEDGSLRNKLVGIFCTLMSTLNLAASATCVPLLERKIPDFELNLFRSSLGLFVFSMAFVYRRQWPKVQKSEIFKMAVICVISTAQSCITYIAVSLIPLSYFKSVYMSANMIIGLFIYPFCLDEKINFKKIILAFICVCGVILSIQPDFIFTWKKHESVGVTNSTIPESKTNYLTNSKTVLGCLLSLTTGSLSSLGVVALKKTPSVKENVAVVLFWASAASTFLSVTGMSIFEKPVLPTTTMEVVLISIHSLTYSCNWVFHIIATRYLSGEVYSILLSTLVITMLIPQYTLLKHILPGNHNWIEVCGSVLVFFGATAGSVLEIIKS